MIEVDLSRGHEIVLTSLVRDILVQLFYQVFKLSLILNQSADLVGASLYGILQLHVLLIDNLLALLTLDDFLSSKLRLQHSRIDSLRHCNGLSWLA